MGKKKKSVSQVVIAQSDTSDDLKPETDAKLEETKLQENEKNTSEILITTPPAEETCQIQMAEKEQLNEDTPILSNTEDVGEPTPENDKKVDEVKEESKTVETTTSSENSVELKEIQLNPQEDEAIKKTKTNCSKGWFRIF
jgi:hypothetical protein